jgi:hypothetical protein
MSCLACKTKVSLERCEAKALTNLAYCGRHMRCKRTNSWVSKHAALLRYIVKFQAHCRGFIARRILRLAGKGVLRRGACHNDTEIVTLEEKTDVHPHDYFSIEEDGKVWWFDQRSMFQWSQKELEIRNPYTRSLLSKDDTRRLRELMIYRRRRGLSLYHIGQQTPMDEIEKRDNRWMRIAQILREHEYDIHHEHFISLDFPKLFLLINTLTEDTRWWHAQSKDATLQKYHLWLKNMRNVMSTYTSMTHLSRDIAGILLTVFYEVNGVNEFAYYLFSAYNRISALEFIG